MIVFDIETIPLGEEELRAKCPKFDDAEFVDPGEFDPASVKVGNMKDPDKIREKVEAKRVEHETTRANLAQNRAAAEAKHFADFCEKAGLSAATSRMLVCGVWSPVHEKLILLDATDPETEADAISRFWQLVLKMADQKRASVGLNIYQFDLPYLVNRSWLLGVPVPPDIFSVRGSYVNWHTSFVDLRQLWLLGRRFDEKSSHDFIGKAFGTGGKCVDGVSGGDFWKVWTSDREKALEYLVEDLKQPAIWAERMGVR